MACCLFQRLGLGGLEIGVLPVWGWGLGGMLSTAASSLSGVRSWGPTWGGDEC